MKDEYLMPQNLHVEIEATNFCNTNCLHCPHDAMSRASGKMDWETYQTVIDKVSDYSSQFSVEFAGMGEPLLHPRIYSFIAYVTDQAYISLTTNLSPLNQENAQRLIDSGLNRLTISYNGDDQDTYELMMGGLSFERARENLSRIVEMSKGTQLEVIANVSVTKQTQTRLSSIRKELNLSGIDIILFSKCHNRGGFLKGDSICDTPIPPLEKSRCDIFRNTLFVAWTGEVLACCHDLAGDCVIGNLQEEQLESIFHRKERVLSKGVNFDICEVCNDLYRFMNDFASGQKQLSDWVYSLYAEDRLTTQDEVSPIFMWLYDLYQKENKSRHYVSLLSYEIETRREKLKQLEVDYQASLAARNQEQEQYQSQMNAYEKELNQMCAEHQKEIEAKNQETLHLQDQIHSANVEIGALRNIAESRSWRLMTHIHKVRHFFIPPQSHRERLLHQLLRRLEK